MCVVGVNGIFLNFVSFGFIFGVDMFSGVDFGFVVDLMVLLNGYVVVVVCGSIIVNYFYILDILDVENFIWLGLFFILVIVFLDLKLIEVIVFEDGCFVVIWIENGRFDGVGIELLVMVKF